MDFLIAEGITKYYGDRKILEDVNFKVREGQWFGVMGKSGSGKTVLMSGLRGIKEYEPTSGTVIYNVAACPECSWVEVPSKKGEECVKCGATLDLEEVNYWDSLKRNDPIARSIYDRIGHMVQRSFALFGELTVLTNLKKIMDAVGVPRGKQDELAMELLDMVKIKHRINHRAGDLSGGEKQRCLFAMVIVKNPFFIFADEPSGTLDRITAQAMHEVMATQQKRGVAAIVNSHFPEEVAKLTDEAIFLKDGVIDARGKVDDVVDHFLSQYMKIEIDRKECTGRLIEFEKLRKYFVAYDRGLIKAVNDVTENVMENEIFGIVGVSGSGKTTLSRVLGGFVVPSKGMITIRKDGTKINMMEVGPTGKGRITPQIAILHQEYTLHHDLNVFENLHAALPVDVPMDIVAEKVYNVLKAVGFPEEKIDLKIYDYPFQLSEGERQRLAIAVTLMNDPKIVFLDEPTGTADPLTRIELARSLRKARESFNQTYIIVSHDMDFVDMVCDRAALMRNGEFARVGDPSEIIDMMKELEVPIGDLRVAKKVAAIGDLDV
jgi:methyl coenzyme M reductase system subunit A2